MANDSNDDTVSGQLASGPVGPPTWRQDAGLGLLIALVGAAALAALLELDAFGGTRGIGRFQLLVAIGGGVAIASGALLLPSGRRLAGRALVDSRSRAIEAWGLLGITAQLGVALWLMSVYRIESPAFYERVVPLVAGGFLVNHLLPLRWRLDFFAILSVAAIVLVFGPQQGAWVLGLGVALISLCHVPGPFFVRLGLLLCAAALLATMRAGWLPTPWSPAIWPILGSMFMFRLVIYVYDLRHLKQRAGRTWPLAYFFCLPNVAFPLFPVIDFATFRRTYYDQPALGIYQQGIGWIYRGLLHLIAYRLVYGYGTMSPAAVDTGPELVRYVLANFGLYLRVSGQFHLIVGLLHLFGFRLPETHRFFFLASSFTDFWRRINIYWKDFMQKVFFYPAYFRLKRRGETEALIGSTLAVFAVTWFFHSYQWFWVLGTWLWSTTDTLFWAILAVLLVLNSLREVRKGRSRSLGTEERLSWRGALSLGGRTAATFTVLCLLWTLWTSPTVGEFLALLGTFSPTRVLDLGSVVAVLFTVGVLAVLSRRRPANANRRPLLAVAGQGGLLAGLWVAGMPAVGAVLPNEAREVLRDLRVVELNNHDQERLQRGYYENLVGVNRFNGELWRVYAGEKVGAEREMLEEIGVIRSTTDARHLELVPFAGTYFLGQPFRTNQWGMRDQDYEQKRAAGTHRTAVLGPSYAMGWGVGDGETFEAVLETMLNAAPERRGARRYEVLNFAVNDYGLFQHRYLLTSGRVFEFDPDVVMVVGHQMDLAFITDYLRGELISGRPPADDSVRSILRTAGITAETSRNDAQRRMEPHRATIARWLLRDIAEICRARGVKPIFALVPTPSPRRAFGDAPSLVQHARDAGFVVLDLHDVYRGRVERELMVSATDVHPNAEGHRVIGRRIMDELELRPELLRGRQEKPTGPGTR